MFHNYRLTPSTVHIKPIAFEWNPATGEVRGVDAELVRNMAARARIAGEVVGHPYPTPYTVIDPLHTPADLAVVLGNDWQLPPDLAAAYPQPETDDLITEIDGDGVEHPSGLEPLY